MSEALHTGPQFGQKVSEVLSLETFPFGGAKIILDDYELVVDASIVDVFDAHFIENIRQLERWIEETTPKGLDGKVYQRNPREESLGFTVNMQVPDIFMPGKMRTRLRQSLTTKALVTSYMEMRVVDEVCSICGFRWIRELLMRTEMIKWIQGKGESIRYSRSFPDTFTMSSNRLALQMKLTWIDR